MTTTEVGDWCAECAAWCYDNAAKAWIDGRMSDAGRWYRLAETLAGFLDEGINPSVIALSEEP